MFHSSFAVLQVCHRVAERNSDATFDKLVDCFRRPLLLRRQGNDGDVAYVSINVHDSLESIIQFSDAMSWMCAFLINWDKWTFDMNAQYGCAMYSAGLLLDLRENLMICFSWRCYERRTEARYAMREKSLGDCRNSLMNRAHVVWKIDSVATWIGQGENRDWWMI